ncbi:hypothetical protein EDM80_06695 [bacterium]|nr:MAG: hypothetical protein EDM80_06695 [bacterium]RIK61496.1 MAG: hypothetical protein DCC64_13445 [Planctomycetota bacterium]
MRRNSVLVLLVLLVGLVALGLLATLHFNRPRGRIITVHDDAASHSPDDLTLSHSRPACSPRSSARSTAGTPARTAGAAEKIEPPITGRSNPDELPEDMLLLRMIIRVRGGLGLHSLLRDDADTFWVGVSQGTPDDILFEEGGDADRRGLLEFEIERDALPRTESGSLHAEPWRMSLTLDREHWMPVSPPRLTGKLLDFGVVEVDLQSLLGEGEVLAVGRLLQPGGQPLVLLEWVEFTARKGEDYLQGDDSTDDRGGFQFILPEYQHDEAWTWQLSVNFAPDDEPFPMPKPRLTGRILDFGEVFVPCAALEVTLAGLAGEDERSRLAGGVTPPTPTWEFSYRDHDIWESRGAAAPKNQVWVFARVGTYFYDVNVYDEVVSYCRVEGSITLKLNEVQRLTLSLERASSVHVQITTADGPSDDALLVVTVDEGEERGRTVQQMQIGRRRVSIATPAAPAATHITARVDGWAEQSLEIKADSPRELTLTLTERAPKRMGTVRFRIPEWPKALSSDGDSLLLAVNLAEPGGKSSRFSNIYIDPWQRQLEIPMDSGTYEVSVCEAYDIWGYPMRQICPPLGYTVVAGEVVVVELPSFADPPWTYPTDSVQIQMRVDERVVAYSGPGVASGKANATVRTGSYQRNEVTLGRFALTDGDQTVEMELIAPAARNEEARIVASVPARVEVRALRGGKALSANFTATLDGAGAACTAVVESDSRLLLWAPVGRKRLTISAPGMGAQSRAVEVRAGECQVVEFSFDDTHAVFAWSERYVAEEGCHWRLYHQDGGRVAEVEDMTPAIQRQVLRPGSYYLRPWCIFDNSADLRFTMSEGQETRVEVPFVARPSPNTRVKIPLPDKLPRSPDGYELSVHWYPAAAASRTIGEQLVESSYAPEVRILSDQLVITGLPASVELAFTFSIGSFNTDPNSDASYLPLGWLVPWRTIKLAEKADLVLNHAWVEGRTAHPHWSEVQVTLELHPDNAPAGAFYSTDDFQVFPPQTCLTRWSWHDDDGKETRRELRVQFSFSESGHARLPRELAQALADDGLYSPPEGESSAGEGG